jgi:uncharacterized protein YndB with AHSA1/START domain
MELQMPVTRFRPPAPPSGIHGWNKGDQVRELEMKIEIDATAQQVWEALTTAQGVTSWFAPVAEVQPGPGGHLFASWGPGMEGTERIEIWEPNRRLRIAHDRREGAPPSVVDYHVEGHSGATVMRLVHSGFADTANFDDEFESTAAAWPVFLKMMKHSVERGVASCRNVTVFRMLEETQPSAWAKLMQEPFGGVVRHQDGRGNCCFEFPERNHAMLSIFCEKCGGKGMLTMMWLLYGASEEEAAAVKEQWSAFADRLFGRQEVAV